jgi:hypothetical protein
MHTEKRFQCRHIFTDGHRCGSPTLLLETPDRSQPEQTHEDFCYYHHTTRRPRARTASENPAQTAFDLPLPEDRSSIQAAIGEVLRNIAANTLDPRRAGLLLYGLQIAALNLPPHPRPHPLHERDEIPEPVTAIITHPTHGPIAPAAELAPPPVYKSIGRMLLDEFGPEPSEAQPLTPAAQRPDPLWHPSVFAPDHQRVRQPIPEEDQQTIILPNLQAAAEGAEGAEGAGAPFIASLSHAMSGHRAQRDRLSPCRQSTQNRVPHVSPLRHGFRKAPHHSRLLNCKHRSN